MNTIFVNRAGTKEEKAKILNQICERQKTNLKNQGEGFNLHIFPEGFTTNGSYVLPFQKGAFLSLLPIKPLAFRYHSDYFSPAHDVIPMGTHLVLLLSQFYSSVEVFDLPIFEPNEYLFKNHMKSGEEKWMVFSKAVQECIASTINRPKSKATLKEKLECQEVYFIKNVN